MEKSEKQIKARNLRHKGLSIKAIAKMLGVSKSSVSIWCRDIGLTKRQIAKLHKSMVAGSYAGRMKGALLQRKRKNDKIEKYLIEGVKEIGFMTKREFFIAGLCLYWGEGSRKNPGARFYNSDPSIIKFIIKWFREILKISNERFFMYVTINKIHQNRTKEINSYWSKVSGIPIGQFRKPIFIKAKNKKTYKNANNYYGTLCIRVSKGTDLFYQILGWLRALGAAA
jgi:transcriptional regulator with XRE-family HTH domain